MLSFICFSTRHEDVLPSLIQHISKLPCPSVQVTGQNMGRFLAFMTLLSASFCGKGYAQIYTPGQAGYGGNLGGYALGGALTSFGGNCSQPSGWGSQYYANSTENGDASTATGPLYLTTCGFANGTRKVFGYYGYDLPKPPLGITYPNIGWPYSIPYPYFTQPAYGPVGLPYYGVPAAGYNPYLFGWGSYSGIYGAARSLRYLIPPYKYTSPPEEVRFISSPVYKGFKFGPGGQVIDYYR